MDPVAVGGGTLAVAEETGPVYAGADERVDVVAPWPIGTVFVEPTGWTEDKLVEYGGGAATSDCIWYTLMLLNSQYASVNAVGLLPTKSTHLSHELAAFDIGQFGY